MRLEGPYTAIFIDAISGDVRDGEVANRSFYAAIGVALGGERDVLGLRPASVVRAGGDLTLG